MKKRIISLILVVATAFLTLTGCAYNYAKDDMSKYATINAEAFKDALQKLVITDGDFGTNEETRRNVKVEDAIAQALLKVIDTTDKKYAGKLNKYDSLYFCYYAEDNMGNIFFGSKMDESKLTNIQLGLDTLTDFNKLVSDGAIALEDIAAHIYSTSSATVVGLTDVVSLTYVKTWYEGEEKEENKKTETFTQEYTVIDGSNEFHKTLVGKPVGVELDDVTVSETINTETLKCTYSDIKVESIVKDNSTDKVEAGDKVFVTYTISFNAKPWYNEETKKYDLPVDYPVTDKSIDEEGNYKCTFSYVLHTAEAAAEGTADADKTFLQQLVGKSVGTTSTITVKSETIGNPSHSLPEEAAKAKENIEVKYSSVKVNWIVNSDLDSFTVKYKPYDEKLKDDNSNKKTELNQKGQAIILNDKDGGIELTYHIFPVYYLDVEALSAETVLREFYSTVLSQDVADHDHTEDEHEHEYEYIFETLKKDEYKNGDKTVSALVTELKELFDGKVVNGQTVTTDAYTTKEKALTDALKALNTAQSNQAKGSDSDAEKQDLEKKLQNAHTAYLEAKTAFEKVEADVEAKIAEILACKKGDETVENALVTDYKNYQYDVLEDAYKNDIKGKLATEIIEYLEKNVEFKGNLPKRAVKDAYKAILNTYKYDFYENNYSSGSNASTSTETNYAHYDGDFDAYLVDKLLGKKNADVKLAYDEIQKQAEETVKEIIRIYVFASAVESAYNTELFLTSKEKKEIKKEFKNYEALTKQYQSYGINYKFYCDNLDTCYNFKQFDKVMNYLLEENEDAEGNVVKYLNVSYSTEAENE